MSLGIFSLVPPREPCALKSTQPQKMSTRDFSWGKGSRCVWLTTYQPCSAETLRKSGALIYPEPLGPPRPVVGDLTLLSVHSSVAKGHNRSGEIVRGLHVCNTTLTSIRNALNYSILCIKYGGWNFKSGNYLFTTDTK